MSTRQARLKTCLQGNTKYSPPAPKALSAAWAATPVPHLAQSSSSCVTRTVLLPTAAMSLLRASVPCVISSISVRKSSIWVLYSSSDWMMASLKSSMSTKLGKKGRMSSTLSKESVSFLKAMALRMFSPLSLLSCSITCWAITSHSFFRKSWSSSATLSATLFASSRSTCSALFTASSYRCIMVYSWMVARSFLSFMHRLRANLAS
mmetsp:Transcript_3840/g.9916  ORF Transcript_3840/g.9916 Transcript_3840/m.9916 type:complete len:206 (+) Transcript_3840:266-883(+)